MNLRWTSLVLALSVLVLQPALTQPVSADADYVGTVTLSANRTSITTDEPSVTLTAVASPGVPMPWRITIYGQSGSSTRKVVECTEYEGNRPTTCGDTIRTLLGPTETFTAFIAQNAPARELPTEEVTSQSTSITVTDRGYVGTVALSANRTSVTSDVPSVTLTATASSGVPMPWRITIYGQSGSSTRKVVECTEYDGNRPRTCEDTVSALLGPTETFTAFITQSAPARELPTEGVSSQSAPITVTDRGYVGTILLGVDRTQVTSENTSATLTALVSSEVPMPWRITIYGQTDALTRKVAECTEWYTRPITCQATLSAFLGPTEVFTAYVSQDAPYRMLPETDVRARSFPVAVTDVSDTGPVDLNNIDEFQYEAYVAYLGRVSLSELCAPLAWVRDGVSSAPRAFSACVQAVLAGQNLRAILRATAAVGGLVALDRLLIEHTDPATPDPNPDPDPTAPTPCVCGDGPPGQNADPIIGSWVRDSPETLPENAEGRKVAADTCRELVARANLYTASGRHPCVEWRVFFSGSDVPEPTWHDLDVLVGNPREHMLPRPWLIEQHYIPGTTRENFLSRDWYNSYEPCKSAQPRPEGQDCDEFPLFSTAESGPQTPAHLRLVNAVQNRSQGGKYRAFVHSTRCNFDPSVAGNAPDPHNHFLFTPVAGNRAPSTTWICR